MIFIYLSVENGDLYSWGSMKHGILGLGNCGDGFVATTRKNRILSNVKSLCVGRSFVIALTSKKTNDNLQHYHSNHEFLKKKKVMFIHGEKEQKVNLVWEIMNPTLDLKRYPIYQMYKMSSAPNIYR